MKKKFKSILLLILLLILTSCTTKRVEYKIIPISGAELINSMEEGNNFLVFMYTDNSTIPREKLEEIKRLKDTLNTDIYHIDPYHIDIESEIEFDLYYMIGLSSDKYIVVQDGKIAAIEYYTDFNKAYKELNTYKYNGSIKYNSEADNEANIAEAEKYYNEGNIFMANQFLSKAWSSEKAREFVDNHQEFLFLHYWEKYEYTGSNSENLKYTGINPFTADSQFGKIVVESKATEFQKPDFYENQNKYYYKIQDMIIYVGTKEDKLNDKYEITYIDKEHLIVKNMKTNVETHYTRRD